MVSPVPSATAHLRIHGTDADVHHRYGDDGLVTSVSFERWGDPDRSGTWGWYRCGGDVVEHRSFGAGTVPSAGTFGWHYGTERWPEGEFFRYRLHSVEPMREDWIR